MRSGKKGFLKARTVKGRIRGMGNGEKSRLIGYGSDALAYLAAGTDAPTKSPDYYESDYLSF